MCMHTRHGRGKDSSRSSFQKEKIVNNDLNNICIQSNTPHCKRTKTPIKLLSDNRIKCYPSLDDHNVADAQLL